MEKLAKAYNKFLFEKAPEQLEELVFSRYLNKWLILNHSKYPGIPGVCVVKSKAQMAEEFLKVVAYHALESEEFAAASILRRVELINGEIAKQKDILSEYIELTDELLNEVCSDALGSLYR